MFQELRPSALNHISQRRHLAVVSWKASFFFLTFNSVNYTAFEKVQAITYPNPWKAERMLYTEEYIWHGTNHSIMEKKIYQKGNLDTCASFL